MQIKEKRPMGGKIKRYFANFGLCVLLFIAFLGFFAAWWYVRVYGRIGFDSVLYTLTGGLGGVSTDLIAKFLTGAVLPAVLCTGVTGFPLLRPWKWKRWIPVTVSIVLSLGLLVHAAFNVELISYLFNTNRTSDLYEQEYVDPNDVRITFPQEKRNLIYIFLESMETSYLSQDLGGGLAYNLIPELTQLAQQHINFSHNESVGGFMQVPGTTWTAGAMVAHTGGIPMKVVDGMQNAYGQDGTFLDNLTTLTSILHDAGYYQALMVGSDVSFGGRDTFYENHGVDAIYDLYTGRADGLVRPNYWNGWWGFEDLYLYDYAQQVLTEMAQQDQPFAFTMLTVDTHHVGGYACQLCGSDYEENYENVIACASRQAAEFVAWIMEQDFYEDTTIVVVGDHYSMDNGYFNRAMDDDYERHVYNCFINAAATPVSTTNRQFCTMDLFPTTLAAMGCTIEGDRLGLGTNLFSAASTLMEEMGYTKLCSELSQNSDYYETRFHGVKTEP